MEHIESPDQFYILRASNATKRTSYEKQLTASVVKGGEQFKDKVTPRTPLAVAWRDGDNVTWCRGRYVRFDKETQQKVVSFIDYGNVEPVPDSDIRKMPKDCADLEKERPLVEKVRLALLKSCNDTDPLFNQAGAALEALLQGQLQVSILSRRRLRTGGKKGRDGPAVYETHVDVSLAGKKLNVNMEMINNGFLYLDDELARRGAFATWHEDKDRAYYIKAARAAVKRAKKNHKGIYEFGDPDEGSDDDDVFGGRRRRGR